MCNIIRNDAGEATRTNKLWFLRRRGRKSEIQINDQTAIQAAAQNLSVWRIGRKHNRERDGIRNSARKFTMARRQRNRKRPQQVTRPAEPQIINPYKPMTAQEIQDEIDALSWVRPTFKIPILDKILEGVEREAEQMMRIFKL